MRPGDVEGLTLGQIGRIFDHHNRRLRRERAEAWNLMRYHACLTMQPHLSAPLTPRELLQIPEIDGEEERSVGALMQKEKRRRMEEVRRNYEQGWQDRQSR